MKTTLELAKEAGLEHADERSFHLFPTAMLERFKKLAQADVLRDCLRGYMYGNGTGSLEHYLLRMADELEKN